MPSLYDLASDIIAASEQLDAAMDAPDDADAAQVQNAVQTALDAIHGEFDEKVERVALWIKDIEVDEANIRAEVDRLVARANARKNKARRIKEWLLSVMVAANRTKVRGTLRTVSVSAGKEKIVVPLSLLESLSTIYVTPSPARDALLPFIDHKESHSLKLKELLATVSPVTGGLPDALTALDITVTRTPFLNIR